VVELDAELALAAAVALVLDDPVVAHDPNVPFPVEKRTVTEASTSCTRLLADR
jgi:hypothetical protein